jgi:histidyl-tRNA synthetase
MARKEPIRAVKGMRDILPPESALWNHIEETARRIFRSYAYQEIRTPLVEPTELFARGVGADTDIVTKEMYTWEDWSSSRPANFERAAEVMSREGSGQSLTLRPEATASVIRAYIEHSLWEKQGIWKLYYIGPMFRRDRPQKGRYRQFYQIGAEIIGTDLGELAYGLDSEIIYTAVNLLQALRLENFTLWLNSVGCPQCRPQYLAKLQAETTKVRNQLCEDCQRRSETNPLRVLDCKVPEDQAIIGTLPMISDSLCENCRTYFAKLQALLEIVNIPFTLQPRLVRGLDYYTRTTFEIVHEGLGAQNSLLGGGRYDGLSEALGGPRAPGVGFSIGEDRLASVLTSKEQSREILYLIWLGDPARSKALKLATILRGAQNTNIVQVLHEPLRLKKALEMASRLGASHVLIIGDRELEVGRFPLRDMLHGTQEIVTEEELLKRFLPDEG